MPDHVYRIIEVAGSSEKSIEDAIQNAVGRASRTLRQVGWFEVVETRGHVEDGKVAHYQVTLKVGFTLDDDAWPGDAGAVEALFAFLEAAVRRVRARSPEALLAGPRGSSLAAIL
jgi:flavin-binding protein dodecin